MKRCLLFLFVVALATGFLQRQQIKQLQREIEAQKHLNTTEAASSVDTPKTPRALAEEDELSLLRAEKPELLRLRGVVAQARKAGQQSPDQIEAEIKKMERRISSQTKTAQVLQMAFDFQQQSKAARALLDAIQHILREAALQHNGRTVRSFEELERIATETRNIHEHWTFVNGEHPFGLGPRSFEFVHSPHQGARAILLKERQPRRYADLGWHRLYLFSDCQIRELHSKDGNFDSVEIGALNEPVPLYPGAATSN